VNEDLESLLEVTRRCKTYSGDQASIDLLRNIEDNKVPKLWLSLSFNMNHKSLVDFMRVLLMKYETIKTLVLSRDGEMFPVLPLHKLIDPLSFFTSMLWQFSLANSVSLCDLEIQLIKLISTKLPTSQSTSDGVFITGFSIRGGSLNTKSLMLEEEVTREFEHMLPPFLLRVGRRQESKTISKNHEVCFLTKSKK
jgi:hypothetical protein